MSAQGFAAYAMLPQQKAETLAPALQYAWPVDETPFNELLLLVLDETDQGIAPSAIQTNVNFVRRAG